MRFDLDLTGVEKLEMTIYNAHAKVTEQASKVTKNNGEKLMKKAKELAPTDTWFLHDNIISKHFPLYSLVHSQASYSGYVNFGTRFMYAQPFMTDAVKWIMPLYQKDMTDVMKGAFK